MSTLRILFLLSAIAYTIVCCQQRGDLRFSGSFADGTSGRLEVFIDNQWGTICIDGFTKRSADTACRQLGSFEALTFGEAERLGYGRGIGQIHITELECSRNDIHILHCTVRDDQQCDHSSDVAIICSAITAFQYDGGMRLLGGPHRSEGILELYYFGQWGGVCGQSFDVIAADAACVAFGYTRSRSFSFVSRFENMSSPVWVISSFINCASTRSCFSNCYGDPTVVNDLSSLCSNNYVYLNCEFIAVTNSRCLAMPFSPNPNGDDFGIGDNVEDPDEDNGNIGGIIYGSSLGAFFLVMLIVFCTACGGYRLVKKCCKGCYECLPCSCGGCLSILRNFGNDNNGNTPACPDTYTPNMEPRSTINQELEELELAAMNEPSSPQRPSNSSSDSEHGDQQGNNEPPDYRNALKFRAKDKEDSTKLSLDDQLPPPSYDAVV